jgi:uncharacterized membrane protein
MARQPAHKGPTCVVCGRKYANSELRSWASVRPSISALIAADTSRWSEGCFICREDLARYRRLYVERLLEDERGEIGALEREVIASLELGETISQSPEETIVEHQTFGDRMADRVASFGGSWTFILGFCAVLVCWMLLNTTAWLFQTFDPFPYILLNLVLSCIAALQAPVIMMSQRRQEMKDRLRAENDYKINLKAELEIRQLHEKMDHQLAKQWERLAEMQQIQIELLEERTPR